MYFNTMLLFFFGLDLRMNSQTTVSLSDACVSVWEPSTGQWSLSEDITLIPRRIHNTVTQSNEHFSSRTYVFNAVDT